MKSFFGGNLDLNYILKIGVPKKVWDVLYSRLFANNYMYAKNIQCIEHLSLIMVFNRLAGAALQKSFQRVFNWFSITGAALQKRAREVALFLNRLLSPGSSSSAGWSWPWRWWWCWWWSRWYGWRYDQDHQLHIFPDYPPPRHSPSLQKEPTSFTQGSQVGGAGYKTNTLSQAHTQTRKHKHTAQRQHTIGIKT